MSDTASPSRLYTEARQALVTALQVDDEPTKPLLDYVQQAAGEIERLRKALHQEEAVHGQTVDERDSATDWADKLSDEIAGLTGVEIGEHSNVNNPWLSALEAVQQFHRERARAEHDQGCTTKCPEPPAPKRDTSWVAMAAEGLDFDEQRPARRGYGGENARWLP